MAGQTFGEIDMDLKDVGVGLVVGLLIGVFLGFGAAPRVRDGADTSGLEAQVAQLQQQVGSFEDQLSSLQGQLDAKDTQIAELETQIEELEAMIPPLRKGEWNPVETFTGASGFKTDFFYVAGPDLRITWTWTGDREFGVFYITLYEEGRSVYTEIYLFLQDEGETFSHGLEPGNYYLDISAANMDSWTVTVEVFIPEA